MEIGQGSSVRADSGSIVIGPAVIEFQEEGFHKAMAEKKVPMEQNIVVERPIYTEKFDLVIEKLTAICDVLEDIRYFSVPWYIRAQRWIKGKLKWGG